MNTIQTKTKYYSSNYQEAPTLTNTWGSLANLLSKVLSEGFNLKTVQAFLPKDGYKVEVILPEAHGYVLNQVVNISGSSDPLYNKDFRVLATAAKSITIQLETSPIEVLSAIGTSIRSAPLGYTKVYSNPANTTICFKNGSTQSPAILKVIDETPPNGYSAGWCKFARVVVGQAIDNEGNFIGNRKAPYHIDYPEAEKTGNGSNGAAGIHGFAKWNYSFSASYSGQMEASTPTVPFPRSWHLIGDDKTFYLYISASGLSGYYTAYGYGNFVSDYSSETYNIVLQAGDKFRAANSDGGASYDRVQNTWGTLSSTTEGSFLYSTIHGYSYSTIRYYCGGLYTGESSKDRPWRSSTNVKTYNPASGKYFTSKLYIRDQEGYMRGYHRGIRILYSTDRPGEGLLGDSNLFLLNVSDPLDVSVKMPLIFSMEDWEEWP